MKPKYAVSTFRDANSIFYNLMAFAYHFEKEGNRCLVEVMWHFPEYVYGWQPLEARLLLKDFRVEKPGPEWQVSRIVKPVEGSFSGKAVPYSQKEGLVRLESGSTPVFVEFRKL